MGCAGREASGAAPNGTSASGTPRPDPDGGPAATAKTRMPAVYLPHGGGPWPFVDLPMGEPAELDALATYLRGLPAQLPERPKALLVVSAHWEESVPTLMTAARPPMLYDYYGFPPEAYRITWPAPGAPELAERVRKLVAGAGFTPAMDATRGFDHGTFVPLKLAYPGADVPTLQLSLVRGLDPATHVALGRALAPLRDEGVFIVGSGMSYHNMGGFRSAMMGARRGAPPVGGDFDDWLAETAVLPHAQRDDRLTRWAEAPGARSSHPREEHLLPLMVIAGAAAGGAGTVGYSGTVMGARISALHFA
ncbi:MAG: dioxygenase [Deltaproteobacteria bacterium]|nr:MAG: dioxygenase [Deltaproteobacteria bacterium]